MLFCWGFLWVLAVAFGGGFLFSCLESLSLIQLVLFLVKCIVELTEDEPGIKVILIVF